jgi:hypothetical protein
MKRFESRIPRTKSLSFHIEGLPSRSQVVSQTAENPLSERPFMGHGSRLLASKDLASLRRARFYPESARQKSAVFGIESRLENGSMAAGGLCLLSIIVLALESVLFNPPERGYLVMAKPGPSV